MESNCIRESSKACFNTCCINPLLSLPEPHSSSPPKSAAATVDPRRNFISAILSSIQPPNAVFTNHESLPSSTELFSSLKNAVLNYSNTVLSDDIRARDYYHLTVSNHVCLDYVGHGLFSYSQKPKSETATSSSSSSLSDDAPFFDISYNSVNLNSYLQYGSQESEFQAKIRKRIIAYMNLYEEDYSLVFTANQSSAFKILADSYPFQSNQNLLTVYDYENEAVRAMVDSATKRGARVQSAVFSWPNFRINARKLRKIIVSKSQSKNKKKGLFVFPLQSRMTGSRYSYQWMNLARENGWHVLLDASALGAKDMETLGLSLFQPDFIICSFFKIFGENPSGFCCLFIKKSSISDLTQSSKSTGIISIKGPIENSAAIDEPPISSASTSQQIITTKSQEIQEIDEKAPELTTEPPKKTLEIEFRGLDHADELGLILISNRLRCLINWLVNALMCLQHPHSGVPLIGIYGPRIKLERGPAVAFNVYDWKGERVDPVLVQKLADRNNISVSVGFLKNIWFDEGFKEERGIVLENRRTKKKKKRREKSDCGEGAVAISIGMLNNFEDVYRIWGFVARFLDADFVEKERWRYTALNQTTVEV